MDIFFRNERSPSKRTRIVVDQEITIFELKRRIIKKTYSNINKPLISDLSIIDYPDFFDEKFESQNAYVHIKEANKNNFFFKDIRFFINITFHEPQQNKDLAFPISLGATYDNMINFLRKNASDPKRPICVYQDNIFSEKITNDTQIKTLVNTHLNAFNYPINAIFNYHESFIKINFKDNKTTSEIRSEILREFKIQNDTFVFQINGKILANKDSIHDIMCEYTEDPLNINIIFPENAMSNQNQKFKEENRELKEENRKLKEENRELKEGNHEFKEENHEFKEENHKLKEEIQQLLMLKSLKKVRKAPVIIDENEYERTSTSNIGQGGFSVVYEVSKEMKFAKKELTNNSMDKNEIERFINESKFLFELRHPCILRIHGYHKGDETHPPSMILNLEPRSLQKAIDKDHDLTKQDLSRITVEIVLGMRHIHANDVIHRDLKLSNILLSRNNHVRICDFGISKVDDPLISKTNNAGTMEIMAPELLSDEDDVNYDGKIDVYAFGLALYYIVVGKPHHFCWKNVINGILPKIPKDVVPWVSDLIKSCLSFNSQNRPSFNDIFETLKEKNYNIFSETPVPDFASPIEERVSKILAFEKLNCE